MQLRSCWYSLYFIKYPYSMLQLVLLHEKVKQLPLNVPICMQPLDTTTFESRGGIKQSPINTVEEIFKYVCMCQNWNLSGMYQYPHSHIQNKSMESFRHSLKICEGNPALPGSSCQESGQSSWLCARRKAKQKLMLVPFGYEPTGL